MRSEAGIAASAKAKSACEEMLTQLADEFEMKAKALQPDSGLIEDEADDEPDDEEIWPP